MCPDRVALEVGEQASTRPPNWSCEFHFPALPTRPICAPRVSSLLVLGLSPHLRKGATLLGSSEDVTLKSKRLSTKARAVRAVSPVHYNGPGCGFNGRLKG